MSLSSGTNLSVLSGVPTRLPTMLCCSAATALVRVKFLHRPGEEWQPITLKPVLCFSAQSLMDNVTLSIHSCLGPFVILLLFITVQMIRSVSFDMLNAALA